MAKKATQKGKKVVSKKAVVKKAPKKSSSPKKSAAKKSVKKATPAKKVSTKSKATKKVATKPAKRIVAKVASVSSKKEKKVGAAVKPATKIVEAKPSKVAKKPTKPEVSKVIAPEGIASPIVPLVPSARVLRQFRQAAKDNKKRQKDKAKERKRLDGFIAKPPKVGKSFKVDLRVHSPGTVGFFTMGGVETASALVRLSKVKGLDIVGITDYYNGVAIDEVKEVGRQAGLTVIPGVDLCCKVGLCEEVHLSALFPETFSSGNVFDLLEVLQVPVAMYGRQDYCLEVDLASVLHEVESRGGVVIPTRLDMTPHRQLAIRPLVEQFGFHAFDVVYPDNLECFRDWPNGQFTFVGFSNAYSLGQVGSRTERMKLPEPTFEAIKQRFKRRTVEDQQAAA